MTATWSSPAWTPTWSTTRPSLASAPQDIDLTYRVVHKDGIRWDDGRLGLRTTVSNQFQARAVANTQVC
jgi:hypothetical protein